MQKDEAPIVVEHSYAATADDVWKAITDVDQMRQWYFENIPAFRPEVGFETQFNVQSGERNFLHLWKIVEVVPGKKITYDWKYEGLAGDSLMVFELFARGDSTRLKLTHRVLESFPGDIPEFARESGVAGWKYFIQQRLKEFLEGNR